MAVNSTASRLRRGVAIVVLAAPMVAAASLPARSAVITAGEILDQFNAVVTDNFSTNSDVEGRLVAGTIDNSGSSTFYNNPKPSSSPSSFQAVNALTISACQSCNVNNGGSVNYINSNSGSFNFNGGGSAAEDNPTFAMSDFTKPLNALETQLGNQTSNSSWNSPNSNSLVFDVTPDAKGVAVFDMTAGQLEGSSSDNYNITFTNETSAKTIIINVSGNFTEPSGQNFNGDTYLNEHVIWNFEGATSLGFKFWHGAVLGGGATVANSSPIEGFLYAKNFDGGGELHNYPFEGVLPGSAPELSTWAMMALGFAGLGSVGLRRRKTPAPVLGA
jgi:choice-of-anchor A domain-containing protein